MIQGDTKVDLDRHIITEVSLGHHTEAGQHRLIIDLGKGIVLCFVGYQPVLFEHWYFA